MKTLIKLSALICIIALALCTLPITVSAMTIYSGNFGFEVDAYGKSVTVVEYIGNEVDVTIPDSFSKYPVTTIAKTAFRKNAVVETVTIPPSIKTIEEEAFSNCSALKSITIPDTVTSLGRGVCGDCPELLSANVNISASKLPDNSFAGCTKLSTVVLSDSITQIGTSAFAKCVSLNNLSFLNKVTVLSDSVFFKDGFTNIEIPESITSIPYYSFAFSNSLQNVVINPTVNYIHPEAFLGSDNVVINCYYDSYAYDFAIENNIPYILLDEYMLGDVDGVDGVNINDVTAIQSHLAELKTVEGVYLLAADANQDDIVDISDATAIQMKLAEYVLPYPIGQYVTKEIVSE